MEYKMYLISLDQWAEYREHLVQTTATLSPTGRFITLRTTHAKLLTEEPDRRLTPTLHNEWEMKLKVCNGYLAEILRNTNGN